MMKNLKSQNSFGSYFDHLLHFCVFLIALGNNCCIAPAAERYLKLVIWYPKWQKWQTIFPTYQISLWCVVEYSLRVPCTATSLTVDRTCLVSELNMTFCFPDSMRLRSSLFVPIVFLSIFFIPDEELENLRGRVFDIDISYHAKSNGMTFSRSVSEVSQTASGILWKYFSCDFDS